MDEPVTSPSDVGEEEPSADESGELDDAGETPEPAGESAVECQWAMAARNTRTNASFDGEKYFDVQAQKPCDTVVVHIEMSHMLHQSLRYADTIAKSLGAENVQVVFGGQATVYESREEMLADPEAGPGAEAVIPKTFDFETMALARYEVLHSRQTSCRDELLRLTGQQAEELQRSRQKWRKRAQKLAGQWRWVPDAVATVRDVEVIDPVLPPERVHPVSGPCQESWIRQPALTPVSREAPVRVFLR